MFGNFWVPMVKCFEGGTNSNNQDFSTLDSGPTGRVTGGNVNSEVSSFLGVPFCGSTGSAVGPSSPNVPS